MRGLVGLAAVVVVGTILATGQASAQYSAFYAATQAELQGAPGTIIRSEEVGDGPWGARSYRILYRSTDPQGEPIAVSGMLIVPDGAPPAGGFPVIAWAHPTTGVADKCAPSLSIVYDVFKTIPGLDDMVKDKFAVVATDYPGLGTAGEHPYLVGVSEARAVLDSVRAAQAAGGGPRFAVWGHSQGGHAALWTGELAATYAPELQLVGVAAAAPASLLGKLFEDDLGTLAGTGLTALTLWSWSVVYGLALDSVVEAEDLSSIKALGQQCLAGFTDMVADLGPIERINKGKFLVHDPVKTVPWSRIIEVNTPGKQPAGAPVFLAQGSADVVVDPPVTTEFAIELCGQGTSVTFHEVPDATHEVIAKVSARYAVAWMADRFAGKTPTDDCIRK